MRHVRDVQRSLLLHDPALRLRSLAGVALHDVHAADDDTLVDRTDLDDLTLLALVTAGEDDDLVAFLDLRSHHSTSGASEMIFMNFLARSSRVTGPKMRVPTGSPCLLISTAALRSNLIVEPSARRSSLAVRTMTARCTSPFFTRPRGIASLIDTTMTSPTVAVRRWEPPSTLMHITRRA